MELLKVSDTGHTQSDGHIKFMALDWSINYLRVYWTVEKYALYYLILSLFRVISEFVGVGPMAGKMATSQLRYYQVLF